MNRLFLLDAYALIYRAYYAFIKVDRRTSSGLSTGVIFGFMNTLNELLEKEHPTHVAVVFDPSGKTFRHEAYPAYKAQREQTPEDIRTGLPYIHRLIAGYKIADICVPGYEADDVIGTLVKRFAGEETEVYMVTPDKDYGQLVGEKIYMYRPRHTGGFELMDEDGVKAKWGIKNVGQVVDILALMGDASDNIPGCPGVGEKTAVKLLGEYGSVEGLLAHSRSLKGSVGQKVRDNKEQIKFSHFLATIKTDAPLPVELTLDSLKRQEIDKESLATLYKELEFRNALQKLVGGEDGTTRTSGNVEVAKTANEGSIDAIHHVDLKSVATVAHHYELVNDEESIERLIARLKEAQEICFDTETTSTDALKAEIVGMSFSVQPHEAWYVPCSADQVEARKRVEMFRGVMEDEAIKKVGQNMKYDMHVLKNYGVEVKGKLFDTMVAHYLLNPELHHGMDYMAETLLGYDTIRIEELIGKGKDQKNMRDVALEQVMPYAAEDADITLQLKEVLERKLEEEEGAKWLMEEMEMKLLPVLARMERTGAILDTDTLTKSAVEMTNRMREIEDEAQREVGNMLPDFNISSPKQVGVLLFDILHLSDKPKKTKTGQYVTDEETLEGLKERHKVVKEILEYRGIRKLLSTYIEALPKLIDKTDGRVHTSYNQTVTSTGRLSSSNPNLQNIPVRDEQGKEIRKAFVATPGHVFMSADYSQVELRIMAHLSGDEHLLSAFNAGADIHAATAAKIFHVAMDEVTKDMRRKAKTANFGIIYGISAFGLAERLNVKREEARQLIDDYFHSFPAVAEYIERSKQEARERGYVETMFKRRRYLPDINSKNHMVRQYAERNAVNAPIQGTAADIIKLAMVKVDEQMREKGLKSELILQVHDELNFNVPQEEVETMRDLVKTCMEGAVKLRVPLTCEVGVGENWLEAH